ncbi:MAG: imidazole glycerol phosphate synthase subunit HisF [Xanthomonadales bacterium]|nr:imidazole glycerol phosphate synthase subunit HisF [Xanthomonadales bacterium]
MANRRIIPSLLVRGERLVKTERFRNPLYVGDPINAVRIFNEKEADEIIVLDISATREGREPNYGLVERIAGECFMPLCYGGGIANTGQARRLFSSGVEKVSINTAADRTPGLIAEIASQYGRQAVVASVDVGRRWWSRGWRVLGCGPSGGAADWPSLIRRLVDAGAGEILLTDVDREGTRAGYNLGLIREAAIGLDVPLVVSGGAGSLEDITHAFAAGASAVAVGAMFVFHGPHKGVLISYPTPEEIQKTTPRHR